MAEVVQVRVEGEQVLEGAEVTGPPWHPASCSLVVAGTGAGTGQQVGVKPGPGQL